MDLKESASASCDGVPVIKNDVDSPFHEADKSCNTSIKDEPLDISELSLKEFKKELEDFDEGIKEEPCLEDTNNPALKEIIMGSIQRSRKTTNTSLNTKKEIFNNTVMNSMVTSPDKSSFNDDTSPMITSHKKPSLSKDMGSFIVTCSKCFSVVHMDNFREHINSCLSRKAFLDKVSSNEADEYKITSANQTVQAGCNPFTSEAVALTDLSFPSDHEQLQKNDDEKNLFSTELSSENKRGRRRYNCNLCSYVTCKQNDLKVHKNGHVKKMPIIQCDKCAFRSTKRALEAHKRKHSSVAYDPASCSNSMVALNNIQGNTEDSLLLEDNTFSCSICSFTTDKQQILKDHERNHRRTNLPIIQCNYCNQRYTRYMLYLHIQNIHPGQRFQIDYQQPDKVQTDSTLESSINSLSTTEKGNMEKHILESTEKSPHFEAPQNCSQFEPIERTTVSGQIRYDCAMCSYSHHNTAGITRHMNSHKKNLPIKKCPECDFRSTKCALICHMQICRSKNTDNSEEGTSKVETSENSLEFSESDKVSSENPLKCVLCSFSTQNKLKLQLHMKEKHLIKRKDSLGRLLYQCALCSFSKRTFSCIISHMNCHEGNVPIEKCPNCDYKSVPKALFCHITKCGTKTKIHVEKNHLYEPIRDTDSSGRQRIRCKMCSYDSNRLHAVLRHFESHKRNIPIINCMYCDFKSTLTAVEHHLKKCKSANVDGNKDMLEKAADKDLVNYFKRNEISSKSEKTNFDLQKSTKTNLNTSDIEIVTDQNAVLKREKLKLQIHVKKKRLYKCVKRKDPLGRLSYHCKLCSYNSKQYIFMIRHMKWHKSNVPILKCQNCDFKSIRRVLISHVRKCRLKTKVHKEKRPFEPIKGSDVLGHQRFYCQTCSYDCKTLPSILTHIKSHERNLPIMNCSFCDFKSTWTPMRHHLKKCKSANVEHNRDGLEKAADKNSENYFAQKEISIKSESVLESTETNLNTLDPEHTKIVSDEPIMGQNSFQSSEKDLFTPKIFMSISGNIYQCKMCSYSSHRLDHATMHSNTHKKKPIINCFNNCGFKSTKNAVSQHFKRCRDRSDTIDIGNTNEAGSVFTCPICTYSTYLRIKLKLHMKKSHFIEIFSCSYCSFFTNYKSSHMRHVKSHARNLPLKKCPYCSFESVPYIINKHVRQCVHKREAFEIQKSAVKIQKYNCQLCSFNTFLDHSYNYHMRTHAFGQPIKKCPQCDFMSTYKALARHIFVKRHFMTKTTKSIKSIIGGKPRNKDKNTIKSLVKYFKCKLCSLVCNRHYILRRHLESHRLNYPIIKCPHCKFKSTKHALNRHIWKNHDSHGIVKKERSDESAEGIEDNGGLEAVSFKNAESSKP